VREVDCREIVEFMHQPDEVVFYAPRVAQLQMDDTTLIPIERSAEDAQFYFIVRAKKYSDF
jgi:hypothetical protein